MSEAKLIKVTKKNGQSSIVPAGQRATYESFNEKYKKLKKLDQVVTIEDYEEAAETKKEELTPPAVRKAVDVIGDISIAKTVEEVDALIAGDERATVLKAAETKKEELAKV